MKFRDALDLMLSGDKVKRPAWGGYWEWDSNKNTVIIHCRDTTYGDGPVIDIRDTECMECTLDNICSEDWEEATKDNCELLGHKKNKKK